MNKLLELRILPNDDGKTVDLYARDETGWRHRHLNAEEVAADTARTLKLAGIDAEAAVNQAEAFRDWAPGAPPAVRVLEPGNAA